jgi:hypothetical protein
MPALRTRTIGIKVTEEEQQQLEAQAEARGLTMSDWGPEVLLAELERGEEASADTVLAEVIMPSADLPQPSVYSHKISDLTTNPDRTYKG